MIPKILITIFIIIVAITLVIRFTISYHFKKFSLRDDPNIKKILDIYNWGTIILFLFCLLFLILFIS